jgi:heme-degrading monooxygenase HmoA
MSGYPVQGIIFKMGPESEAYMYARMTTAQGAPGKVDEGTRSVREQALPAVQKQPGFKGFYNLVDRTSGKTVTLSLWESEAAMQASAGAVDPFRKQAIAAIGAPTPTVEMYEVTVQS